MFNAPQETATLQAGRCRSLAADFRLLLWRLAREGGGVFASGVVGQQTIRVGVGGGNYEPELGPDGDIVAIIREAGFTGCAWGGAFVNGFQAPLTGERLRAHILVQGSCNPSTIGDVLAQAAERLATKIEARCDDALARFARRLAGLIEADKPLELQHTPYYVAPYIDRIAHKALRELGLYGDFPNNVVLMELSVRMSNLGVVGNFNPDKLRRFVAVVTGEVPAVTEFTTLKLNGRELVVAIVDGVPRVRLFVEESEDFSEPGDTLWQQLPDGVCLPDGRQVLIEVHIARHRLVDGDAEFASFTGAELRERVREHLNRMRFWLWQKQQSQEFFAREYPKDGVIATTEFGMDAIGGGPLTAYGVIVRNTATFLGDFWLVRKWFMSLEAAEAARSTTE